MSDALQVLPLSRSRREVLRFLKVAYPIYGDDPHWVAPLLLDQVKVFEDRNPLFEHAELQLWVAVRGGRDVGRIAGVIERFHNERYRETSGFFGFFESINDPQVSRALLQTVTAWAKTKGMTRVLGPMNPTINDECGLLVDGFDASPVLMMTYNPRYYLDLFADAGLQKVKDLYAFSLAIRNSPMDRFDRIAAGLRRRHPDLKVRWVRRRTIKDDLEKVKEIYNAAWEDNWGFVPMTNRELDFMAERLKPLLLEGVTLLAETPREPVGFVLTLPDFNQAIKPLRGRLLTPRVLGLLPHLFQWKKPRVVRLLAFGVKKSYRGRGVESLMLAEGLHNGFDLGIETVEASWILEDNKDIIKVIELFGGHRYKTYRFYERSV